MKKGKEKRFQKRKIGDFLGGEEHPTCGARTDVFEIFFLSVTVSVVIESCVVTRDSDE
jgi:hypothetical protein